MQVVDAIELLQQAPQDAEFLVDTGDGIFKVDTIADDMEGSVVIYLGEMP